MFDINTGEFFGATLPSVWVDFALSVVLSFVVLFYLFKFLRRKAVIIVMLISTVLIYLAWFFNLKLLWSFTAICIICIVVISLFVNQAAVRDFVSNSLGNQKIKAVTEKVYDRHAMLVKIDATVQNLSKNKIGAIITFERDSKLDDFIKSGTILNAPITPELLMTIFYPGTRLHDGAVVIRKDQILAASVYYTPTTKPLNGKFGSRHRASIGISEVSDSVTVVVSEETGRISLAVAGELIHVTSDTFLRTLEDYLLSSPIVTE